MQQPQSSSSSSHHTSTRIEFPKTAAQNAAYDSNFAFCLQIKLINIPWNKKCQALRFWWHYSYLQRHTCLLFLTTTTVKLIRRLLLLLTDTHGELLCIVTSGVHIIQLAAAHFETYKTCFVLHTPSLPRDTLVHLAVKLWNQVNQIHYSSLKCKIIAGHRLALSHCLRSFITATSAKFQSWYRGLKRKLDIAAKL